MTNDILDKLLETSQFSTLDTPIKLKILFALLQSNRRSITDENKEKVKELLRLALEDNVDWVSVMSSMLIHVDEGTLALEELKKNEVFQEVFNQIKSQLKQPLAFSPLQCPYLSPSLLQKNTTSTATVHFAVVKKTQRFTPTVPTQKTPLQKIIQSHSRTIVTTAKGIGNKPTTVRSTTPATALLRKTTVPVNNNTQQTNLIKPSTMIKQPSLSSGRVTSTPIIDVVDNAETRQKKLQKEEQMREAGKNGENSRKRSRTVSADQPQVKKIATQNNHVGVVKNGVGLPEIGLKFAPMLSSPEPSNQTPPMFFVWQK